MSTKIARVRERSANLARQLKDAQAITPSGAASSTVAVLGGAAAAAAADAKLPAVAGQRPSVALGFTLLGVGLATRSGTAVRMAQGALAPTVYEAVYDRMAGAE